MVGDGWVRIGGVKNDWKSQDLIRKELGRVGKGMDVTLAYSILQCDHHQKKVA